MAGRSANCGFDSHEGRKPLPGCYSGLNRMVARPSEPESPSSSYGGTVLIEYPEASTRNGGGALGISK